MRLSRVLFLLGVIIMPASGSDAPAASVVNNVLVGREGRVSITGPIEDLQSQPFGRGDSFHVWIAGRKQTDSGFEYDIRYVPREPKQVDLRDFLLSPQGDRASLPPMIVQPIASLEDAGGRLELPTAQNRIPNRRYLHICVAVGVLWIIGLVELLRRGRNRPVTESHEIAEAETGQSDSERMEWLVSRSLDRSLTMEEAVELERLLRAALSANGVTSATIVDALVPAPQTPALLNMLERWFYSPQGVSPGERELLLERCRGMK